MTSILGMDGHYSHVDTEVLDTLKTVCNTTVKISPPSMTGIVNGPDTHWNKVFKQYMREEMEEHMDSEEYKLTMTGKIKPAPSSKMCDWVVVAWRKLEPDFIKKSFVETGWEQAFNGNDTSVLHSTLRELVDHNIIRGYQRRPDPDEAAAHNLNIQTIRDSMMLGDDVDDIEQADEAVESEDDFEFYRLQA